MVLNCFIHYQGHINIESQERKPFMEVPEPTHIQIKDLTFGYPGKDVTFTIISISIIEL
jgi:hypothetical protein